MGVRGESADTTSRELHIEASASAQTPLWVGANTLGEDKAVVTVAGAVRRVEEK